MKMIKIRGGGEDGWIKVGLLPNDERPGWVEVDEEGVTRWVELGEVHPADQILIKVESVARQRYEWVPPDEIGGQNNAGGVE